MAEDTPEFQKGDLAGVMTAYPHVAEWVRDFEARYGSRPVYYGPLDRDAKKMDPLNLIYITKPRSSCMCRPPESQEEAGGNTLWFGLEPQLNDEEENMKRQLIDTLLAKLRQRPRLHDG